MAGRAIVVGASSGIGAALVRRLVADGWHVCAIARRVDALADLCEAVNAGGPGAAVPLVHDVTALDEVAEAFEDAVGTLGGLDAIVYSAGIMPAIGPDELDTAKDRAILDVNVHGAVAWLNEAARRLGAEGRGTIVGIGSVAGERGRMGNPAYCASKAALHSYLESLRNRLHRRGVRVVTVKPGPVHTPMTAGRTDLALAIDADEAADAVARALGGGRLVVYVPRIWRPIMAIVRAVPSVVFRRLTV